jgi:hypothetical protein
MEEENPIKKRIIIKTFRPNTFFKFIKEITENLFIYLLFEIVIWK